MKRLIILLTLSLISIVSYAQINTRTALRAQVYSSSGTSPNFNVQILTADDLSKFDATNVSKNDLLYVIDGSNCWELRIDTVYSAAGTLLDIGVTDITNTLSSVPSGQAAIVSPYPTYNLPFYVSSLRDDLQSCILQKLVTRIDSITAGTGSQTLSVTGYDLSISSGNTVTLPSEKLNYPLVYNGSGVEIKKGQVVMIDTTQIIQGDKLRVIPAIATMSNTEFIVGVANQNIPINTEGYILWFGQVTEVLHSDIAETGITLIPGNILYISVTEPGKFTNVEPPPPYINSTIALLERKPSPNNMTLLVRPWLNEKLGDIYDVSVTGAINNSVLKYNNTTKVWEASTSPVVLFSDTATIASKQWVISQGYGTLNAVNVTAPLQTTGGNTPTLSIPLANSTTSGYLSLTDWNNFKSAYDKTITGVTMSAGTLTLTARDNTTLTANYTDAGLTSVGITPPIAGISVSGSPLTANGSITLSLSNDLAALEALNATGIAVRTGTDTWVVREITAGSGITITNGTGVSGNISIAHGTHSGDVTGSTALTVVKIQGRDVSSATPSDNQILKWSAANNRWELSEDQTGAPGTNDGVVSSIAVTGTTEKTITLTRTNSLPNLTATFTDLTGSYTAGSGIDITGNVISAVDASATNEAQTLSASGTTSPVISLSQVSGTGGGSVTLNSDGIVSLNRNTNTITISATEVDGSTTNEIQSLTLTNQILGITNGNSVLLPIIDVVAGTGITVSKLAGVATVSAVDASATNELQTLSVASNVVSLSNSGGSVTIGGSGIASVSTTGNTITVNAVEADGSVSNEGSLSVGTGLGNTSLIQSNTSGSPVITLAVDEGLTISETTANNTITLSNPLTARNTTSSGASIFSHKADNLLTFKKITGGGILSVTQTDSLITISGNETIQSLSVNSNTVTLSGMGGSFTIAGAGTNTVSTAGSTITITGTEVDGSTTNELQTLSAATNQITLSNSGGSVTIAGAGTNTVGTVGNTITVTGTEVDGNVSNEGVLGVSAGTGTTSVITSNTSGANGVTISAGTGIGISETTSTNGGTITVTNNAPDQTVSIAAGTGISTSGTYPNFTVTNNAPDQTVSISGAGINVVTGTYPNFTVTATEVDGNVENEGKLSVLAGTETTSVIRSSTANSTDVTITAGSGLSISEVGNVITLTNTAQNTNQTLSLTGQSLTIEPNGNTVMLPLIGVTAGTGITTSVTSGNATIGLGTSGVVAGTYNNSSTAITPFTVDATGRITGVSAAVTITPSFANITSKPTTLSGYGITDAQPLDADLTSIAGLSGTTGLLRKTAANTWTLDTDNYVKSITGTSPVSVVGGASTAATISLASGYGDTQNPYASKNANLFLASPNGTAGVPTFRSIVAADIPTLNQNTTGTASNVTGTVAVANGGTGATSLTGVLIGNGTSAVTGLTATDGSQLLRRNATNNGFEFWTPNYVTSNIYTANGTISSSRSLGATGGGSYNFISVPTHSSNTVNIRNNSTSSYALSVEQYNTGNTLRLFVSNSTPSTTKLINAEYNDGVTTTPILDLLANGELTLGKYGTGANTGTLAYVLGVTSTGKVIETTTSVHDAVTLGTANGLSLSGQQLSLGLASTSTTGALSSTDWNTFNNKQSTISLTTNNNSGAATFSSNTLNIPNYTLSGLGGLSNSTSSTQNGYFGDIFLYDDSTPSNYLQITNSANLTAQRVLSVNVNDADRTISLSGNLTVSGNATVSGTNTGDQIVNDATLTLNVSGTGLSGSQTFTANQGTNATFTITSNATSANTASTIVARDASGNFTAGTITGALSGNATTASTLQTARTIQTNLASTSAASFNGSANITPGVTGTLPIGNGGTGATTAATAIQNLLPSYTSNNSKVLALNSTATALEWITPTGGTGSIGGTGAANKVAFFTDASTLSTNTNFHWDNTNERLGIGMNNPVTTLDVTGGTTLRGATELRTQSVTQIWSGNTYGAYNMNNGTVVYSTALNANQIEIRGITNHPMLFYTNNTEKMRITADGNVGIGTINPAVYSNYTTLQIGSNSTNKGLLLLSDGTTSYWNYVTGNEAYTGTSSNHPYIIQTNNAERLRITSTGNVGIGTNSPSEKFHVSGNFRIGTGSNAYQGIIDGAVTTNSGYYGIWNSSGTRIGYSNYWDGTDLHVARSDGATALTFATNATERLRITATGNVGIGTSSPWEELVISKNSTANPPFIVVNNESPNNTTSSGIYISNNFNNSAVRGGLLTYNGDVLLNVETNSPLNFRTNNTERLRITADGNVGIGTTSPRFKTHIYGTGQTTANLTDAGDRNDILFLETNSVAAGAGGGIAFGTLQSQNNNSIGFASIKGLLTDGANNTLGDLAFSTRNTNIDAQLTERMRLSAGGNLGINNTNPVTPLDITSNSSAFGITHRGRSADNISIMRFLNNGATVNYGQIEARSTRFGLTSIGTVPITFFTNTSNEIMRITSDGNVGINTTTPSSRLTVNGDISLFTTGNKLYFYNFAANNNNYIEASANGSMTFNHSALATPEIMRITPTGLVGIGTDNPSQKLQVVGTVLATAFSGSGASLTSLNASNLSSGTVATARLGTGTANSTTYLRGDNTWATVPTSQWVTTGSNIYYNTGNVGIGTTSPSYALSLGGDAAREIAMERVTTGIGNNLSVFAGGAQSTGSNLNGGNLQLVSGIAKGSGTSQIIFYTAPGTGISTDDSNPTEKMRITGAGNVGIARTAPATALSVDGAISTSVPVAISTNNYSIPETGMWFYITTSSVVNINLPTASTYPGRIISIKTIESGTSNITVTGNVIWGLGGHEDTNILFKGATKTNGSWKKLVSNGSRWIVMEASGSGN